MHDTQKVKVGTDMIWPGGRMVIRIPVVRPEQIVALTEV